MKGILHVIFKIVYTYILTVTGDDLELRINANPRIAYTMPSFPLFTWNLLNS